MTPAPIPKKENNTSLKPLDQVASVRRYVAAASAPATRKAYSSDWRQFVMWCSQRGLHELPATPATVATYVADHEKDRLRDVEAGQLPNFRVDFGSNF